MRRLLAVLATVVGAAVLLSGCHSSSSTSHGGSDPSQRVVVDISIQGDTVSPNGERVDVPVGSPVSLAIRADDDGKIHVHSTPEQEIDYHPGTTQAYLGRFTVPGQVAVESHALGKTLVILVVQ
jgi:hypothetical protein